jgi:hypothetical protein
VVPVNEPHGRVARFGAWWFPPVAIGRIAVLRLLAYLFVPFDVVVLSPWVYRHADVPSVLHRPLFISRLLHLPTTTRPEVGVLRMVLLLAAAVAVVAVVRGSDRLVRATGLAVFLLYSGWMFVAMSYGKVDHDRFGYLVLLAVLPTVGAATFGDRRLSAEAGWAVRMTQVAAVATYFLAAWAKLRFGGWDWATGATLTRAVLRRGTSLADPLLSAPAFLQAVQWCMLLFELASPLLLVVRRDRTRYLLVASLIAFHVTTFLMIKIIFLPHLIALAAFLPLERLGRSRQPASGPDPIGVPAA